MIQLTPTTAPVIIAPVYFCPTAKLSTLLPSVLRHYNQFAEIIIQVHDIIQFHKSQDGAKTLIHMTVHNNLDYVGLPLLHLSQEAIHRPHLASVLQSGVNEQYIHTKFYHRNLDMIV